VHDLIKNRALQTRARGHALAVSLVMRWTTLIMASALCACAGDLDDLEHDEPADFEPVPDDGKADGIPATFDPNNVVADAILTADTAMSVADVQAFFERSPYGNRSWLASFQVGGVSAAELVVAAATEHGINPIILLARMQVEASLVSKTVAPTQYRIDRALGCGCPDGSGCSASYRGFGKQLQCGARILRKWYDGSVAGDGLWVKGKAKNTLDPRRVTPANHATATHYAYTPWVLVGRGGNWLAWNVTRKYLRHARAEGLYE
jgi:hypothetical protein